MFEINTVLLSINLFQVIKSVSLLLGMIGLDLDQGLKMCKLGLELVWAWFY